eukprot:1163481-Prorocentrum_minimum.AAC.1
MSALTRWRSRGWSRKLKGAASARSARSEEAADGASTAAPPAPPPSATPRRRSGRKTTAPKSRPSRRSRRSPRGASPPWTRRSRRPTRCAPSSGSSRSSRGRASAARLAPRSPRVTRAASALVPKSHHPHRLEICRLSRSTACVLSRRSGGGGLFVDRVSTVLAGGRSAPSPMWHLTAGVRRLAGGRSAPFPMWHLTAGVRRLAGDGRPWAPPLVTLRGLHLPPRVWMRNVDCWAISLGREVPCAWSACRVCAQTGGRRSFWIRKSCWRLVGRFWRWREAGFVCLSLLPSDGAVEFLGDG